MICVNGLTLFHTGVFSNFYPCQFTVDGVEFNTSEQYFTYKKALTFKDQPMSNLILKSVDPQEQKRFGRAVGDYNDKIWSNLRYTYMFEACYAKFSQKHHLKQQLLSTQGTRLVEASPTSCIWGIGLSITDPCAVDPANWKGQNLLGKVLDDVRERLLTNTIVKPHEN